MQRLSGRVRATTGTMVLTVAILAVLVGCTDTRTATGPASTGSPTISSGPGATSSSTSANTTGTVPPPNCSRPDSCTTRQLADAAGVTFGTAVSMEHLDEPDYQKTLLATFNSVTAENAFKWDAIHPGPDEWNFGPTDKLVAFAQANHLAVKGHNFIWDQAIVDSTPAWVLAISDPVQLRAAVTTHITTIMDRYRGKVDRWDVVNEPFETLGSKPYLNHFQQVLGDDYIAEMFTIAHQADPNVRLFVNEATVEFLPDKAAALVALVQGLVARGVPINGVGLQTHLVSGSVGPGVLRTLIDQFEKLGVEVAITELDIPTATGAAPLDAQAAVYDQVLSECFATTCREVTLWGFTDRYTWIDSTFGPGRAPLPFDTDYKPKPALESIRAALIRAVINPRPASAGTATL